MSIMKKRAVVLQSMTKEADDVYTFSFEKPADYSWRAGQYALFSITHAKVKPGTKPFSLSSAPAENAIRITTRIGATPSEFKQALLSLKPGMTVRVSGAVGSFGLDKAEPALMIAGGIGITPFRAILKQMVAERIKATQPTQLLYLDSSEVYPFKEELETLAAQASVQLTTVESLDKLELERNAFVQQNKEKGRFLIAGPKPLVDSLASGLQQQGVAKSRMKKDAFFGYL
ncbi:ferredoxin--NADP reductase [Paenibacillus daejeonensis]|uniref:ferredoxin--NADP reductase n=1 Tax=Paenibacillus daejeonensis TaxID=135193 RepID=UPI001FDF224D|nr:FAD-dependent oxidoreductase [Paenibacillus daejeonensis]